MPSITFSIQDLEKLIGKKLPKEKEKLADLLSYCKAEIESISDDQITISLADTNLPYLWSVEGIARLLKGVLSVETGLPSFRIEKSNYKIIVDKSITKIRPFIAGFIAKGKPIGEYLLLQLIQLQEKFCESYGRKRSKVSIGIYPSEKIQFPVHYKAVQPTAISFIPLDFTEKLNLKQILKRHPKGKQYSWIIEQFNRYPILIDEKNQVLSFPPIINSQETGKVSVKDSELFIEVTGTDEKAVSLACNIFSQALFDRGFKIYEIEVFYPEHKIKFPIAKGETTKIDYDYINELLGLNLSKEEIRHLLKAMRFGVKDDKAIIPFYRQDIMHQCDIAEDVAIAYGYNKIKTADMTSYSIGKPLKIIPFIDKVRELTIGAGYQEIFSHLLTNKELLYEKTNTPDLGTVEIKEYMTKTYSVVRTWLIPILLDVLSKNKHRDYPQRIFEEGIVTRRIKDKIEDRRSIALATSHAEANYTEIRQVIDFIMRNLGVNYKIVETSHPAFIPGRVASILVKEKPVGFLGEIHPSVLEKFELNMPVAAAEIDLTKLFG
ncbi:phenylalanine--tRNA ligase subunit beta [Candidatus Woesearchaeota archaeon]|mgnify:CR=1 FL=1|nr:phenylalanine--tRNA ligase subunit beta [Candidatus Woesearchaeota archaeon]RLE40779.1 MAG: phenylalanine--tRNA ligase subunit beta [Candidatus Woesearchaeota archaeon]